MLKGAEFVLISINRSKELVQAVDINDDDQANYTYIIRFWENWKEKKNQVETLMEAYVENSKYAAEELACSCVPIGFLSSHKLPLMFLQL